MSDADLEEIRKHRLAQLQQQAGEASGGSSGTNEQERRQREAEARAAILAQILTPEAADRLNRIKLVKEARAAAVEDRLIMLARTGQLRNKVSEDQLKEFLSAMTQNEASENNSGYIISRRKAGWDDDDLDI